MLYSTPLIETKDLGLSPRTMKAHTLAVALLLMISSLVLAGCSESKTRNEPSNTTSNRSAAANANSATAAPPRFYPKEPDPYVATMTISQEGQPPLQVEFGRMRGDRCWKLQLSGIGDVVYLEKAGLKYLMLPERKQYAELVPGSLAFNAGEALTPTAMVEKFGKARAEKTGKEAINGTMAIKYRLQTSSDAAGQADDLVYIDEGSGLPVRIEAGLKKLNGVEGSVVIDSMNIRLNPDAAMFDVPAGTKKIDAEQLKPQLEKLIGALKWMASSMGQRVSNAPSIAPAQPPANSNRKAPN